MLDKIKSVLSGLTDLALTFLLLGIHCKWCSRTVPSFPDVVGNPVALVGPW